VNGVKVPTLWGAMGVKGKGSDTMTDEVPTLSVKVLILWREGSDTLA